MLNAFTVIAQIINFFILIFLLRAVLYKKIIQVMDERRERIEKNLQEIEKEKKEILEEKNEYQQKLKNFNDQKQKQLEKAYQDAEELKNELVNKEKKQLEKNKKEWYARLNKEKETYLSDIQQSLGTAMFRTCQQIIKNISNADLENEIIKKFINNLSKLKGKKYKKMHNALKENDYQCLISSAFKLNTTWKKKIRENLVDIFKAREINIKYAQKADLICGIELSTRQIKISWNIRNYINNIIRKFRSISEK